MNITYNNSLIEVFELTNWISGDPTTTQEILKQVNIDSILKHLDTVIVLSEPYEGAHLNPIPQDVTKKVEVGLLQTIESVDKLYSPSKITYFKHNIGQTHFFFKFNSHLDLSAFIDKFSSLIISVNTTLICQ